MKSFLIYLAILFVLIVKGLEKECFEEVEYHYTNCDKEGNRWRVAVPQSAKCISSLNPYVVKGKKCNFECAPGEYLDMTNQNCQSCSSGTYSMGGGVRFDDWNTMPQGFVSKSERIKPLRHGDVGKKQKIEKCEGEWRAAGKYLLVNDSSCMTSLEVEYEFVKEGWVAFEYENADENVMFAFEIENERCDVEGSGGRNLKNTDQLSRRQFRVQVGTNKLVWRVLSVAGEEEQTSLKSLPKIRSIEVQGIAFTSECAPCKGGTYSTEGSSNCTLCPPGTFSDASSSYCRPCSSADEYSSAGSQKCLKRQPCTSNDYYEALTFCGLDNMTRKTYHWNINSTCNKNLSTSVQLPPDGDPFPCPPCNPGSHMVEGTCSFCAPDEYSLGTGACKRCPSSTSPSTGIFINSFTNTNLTLYNITSKCISSVGVDEDCSLPEGWKLSEGVMRSVSGNHPSSYLLLNIRVGGFRDAAGSNDKNDDYHYGGSFGDKNNEDVVGFKNNPVAFVSFVFDLSCEEDCILHFIKKEPRQPLKAVEQWTGNMKKQKFTLPIYKASPMSFSWIFQQKSELSSPSSSLSDAIEKDLMENNLARIYSINITNTKQGGAADCQFCPQGSDIDGCIPCAKGHYIDQESRMCKQCTGNTALKGSWGRKACVKCGEGLQHYNHQACVSNCTYTSPTRNATYNFSSLAGIKMVESASLFTTGGFKYLHLFNISLCSNHLSNSPFPLATCARNLTTSDEDGDRAIVESPICRITSLPTESSKPQQLNPANFGDELVSVTDTPGDHVVKLLSQAGLHYDPNVSTSDVYFIFKSDTFVTKACKEGRTSVVVMRCSEKEEGLSLPPTCPDGTCDGCNLVLLMRSKAACPLCSAADFSLLKEDCENGTRQVIKQPITEKCYIEVGKELRKSEKCTVFWLFKSSSSIWLKVMAAGIAVASLAGIVSIVVLIACWKKNKKLEYKYMQLIESSAFSSKDSLELPGVDSCGLEENEEEENFDAVKFKNKQVSSKGKFLSRFRHGAGDSRHSLNRSYYEKNDREERMTLT